MGHGGPRAGSRQLGQAAARLPNTAPLVLLDTCGTPAGPPPPGHPRDPRLPAHDLVGEEDPAHLWVLVLPFVDDGLGGGRERAGGCHRRPAPCPSPATAPACPRNTDPPWVTPARLGDPDGSRGGSSGWERDRAGSARGWVCSRAHLRVCAHARVRARLRVHSCMCPHCTARLPSCRCTDACLCTWRGVQAHVCPLCTPGCAHTAAWPYNPPHVRALTDVPALHAHVCAHVYRCACSAQLHAHAQTCPPGTPTCAHACAGGPGSSVADGVGDCRPGQAASPTPLPAWTWSR